MYIIRMIGNLYCTCRVMRLCAAGRNSSPVVWLDVTVYTGSHPLRPVCVPSDTLSTLPSVRIPHSQLLLLVGVGGNRSCGQGSIIPPHGAVGAKTGSTGADRPRPDICWVCAQDGGCLGSCPHPYFSTVGAFRQSVLDGIRATTLVAEI